jgi:hypothetical protein
MSVLAFSVVPEKAEADRGEARAGAGHLVAVPVPGRSSPWVGLS